MLRAEKEETTCLLDVAGKDIVETSVQVPVKEKKYKSPVLEPVIKIVREKETAC